VIRSEAEDGPLIAAAGLEDSSVLRLLLERIQLLDGEDIKSAIFNQMTDPYIGRTEKWTTPLLRAIERQRSENISLLLEHGANPNGCSIQTQLNLSRFIRRFWNVDAGDLEERYPHELPFALSYGAPIRPGDVGKLSDELVPLTEMEITKRRSPFSRARFWTEPHKKGLDYSRDDALLNSVVRSGTSSPEILDQLLRSGADAHFWMNSEVNEQQEDEDNLSPSALALSTPLHAAIANDNLAMLSVLLDRGFNPNARSLITGSLAVTPTQYAIMVGKLDAYSLLKAHDCCDVGILTPIYGVHILHFAAALLRFDLVKAIGLPLSCAPHTTLGHTLLHIACLPYNGDDVQSSQKIEQSIHEVRNLRDKRYISQSQGSARYDASGSRILLPQEGQPKAGQLMPRNITNELQQQEDMCRFVVSELGATQIELSDIHGNTPLHYLAGAWFLNESLVSWMREQEGGEHAWANSENMWGHTPLVLWEENQAERFKARMASQDLSGGRGARGRGRGRGVVRQVRHKWRRGLG
jgi:ankyrin repeat protein